MDTTFMSYCLASQTVLTWRRYFNGHGIIEADALQQLIHIATYAALPSLRAAARRVVVHVGCGHMVGERRGMRG